jgi:hypothetical protein
MKHGRAYGRVIKPYKMTLILKEEKKLYELRQ